MQPNLEILLAIKILVNGLSYSSSYTANLISEIDTMIDNEKNSGWSESAQKTISLASKAIDDLHGK